MTDTVPPGGCPVTGVAGTVDFDHHDESMTHEQVWQAYRRMQDTCPVARSEHHGGFWVLTRFENVVAAAHDPQTFSSGSGHLVPMVGDNRAIPIDFDPPRHTELRKLFSAAISPRIAKDKEPATRTFIESTLAGLVERGGGELVEELALPLPLWMLGQIVGLSAGATEQLRPLTEASWQRISTESMQEARAGVYALMGEEYDAEPGRTDHIGWLRDEAMVEGRRVSRDEAINVLVGFAIAGHETTLHAVGNLLYQLAVDRPLQERLRAEPEIIPKVVEESLRLRAPAQLFARKATTDTSVAGVGIAAGDQVLLAYAAANRNPDRFPDPDVFDPDREGRQHLSFGWGIHQCAGAPVARMEMRVLLDVLRGLPPFELDGEAEFSHLEGGHHMGPRRLPVRFLPS